MRLFKKNKNPPLTAEHFKRKLSAKVYADWQAKGGEIGQFTYGTVKVHQLKAALQKGIIFKIGAFCSLAKGIELNLCNNHDVESVSTYPFDMVFLKEWPDAENHRKHPFSKGNIEIGSDVWIGNNVAILSGVKIGHGAVIALGSVVTRDIGAYEIWGGVPAKKIKDRFSEEEKRLLLETRWWELPVEQIRLLVPELLRHDIHEFIRKVASLRLSK